MENFDVELSSENKIEDIIYFVKKYDTIASICAKFCVEENQILQDNDLTPNDELQEGDILWIRRRNIATYVVKPLDTIEKIAIKYGVSTEHIKKLNGISNVFIGQKIMI